MFRAHGASDVLGKICARVVGVCCEAFLGDCAIGAPLVLGIVFASLGVLPLCAAPFPPVQIWSGDLRRKPPSVACVLNSVDLRSRGLQAAR